MTEVPAEVISLSKDLRSAAKSLGPAEARFLVDSYYQFQRHRIALGNQIGAQKRNGGPHETASVVQEHFIALEHQFQSVLDFWSKTTELGVWARSQTGIGGVIASGFVAFVDFDKATTAGKIWSFAGLNPTVKWEKKTRRPWNARLKSICWFAGESFVKNKFRENCLYGHLYDKRREYEEAKNEAGQYSDQAEHILATRNFKKDTKAKTFYSEGKLPPGHIHARCKRYAVKIFISHFFEVGYRLHNDGAEPPKPFSLAEMGLTKKIEVPGPAIEDLAPLVRTP